MIHSKKNNFFTHKEVNENLENILKKKIFSNGYIFYGPEGIGKKQTAFEFIKAIFNQYSSNTNDQKIMDNNHPDFLLIEPSSLLKGNLINNPENDNSKNKKEIIKIEQIRNIKTFLAQKSIESEKKIVLIVDADLLNEAASNCLLKTLEEPTNGIFILLTSRLSSLLDTIVSRCQLIRFKSFSYKQLEIFIKNNLDSSILKKEEELNIDDFIKCANGSPGKILQNIQMWNELPIEIKTNLEFPPSNKLDILKISKTIIEELEIDQQIFLVNFMQQKYWKKTRNQSVVKKLEKLKLNLRSFIQPRLAWEVTLLKIAIEDL